MNKQNETPLGMYCDRYKYKPRERSSTLSRLLLVKCPILRSRNKAKIRFLKYVCTLYLRVRHKYSTFFWKNALIAINMFLQKLICFYGMVELLVVKPHPSVPSLKGRGRIKFYNNIKRSIYYESISNQNSYSKTC